MAYYLNPNIQGIISANSTFQGTTISLKWAQAYPSVSSNKIAYAIYMSESPISDFNSKFFQQPVSFISIDGATTAVIEDLTPGILYHFGVRAAEYSESLSYLPIVYGTLRSIPRSLLASDLSLTAMSIPLIDADGFPGSGVVRVGTELIRYSSISVDSLVIAERGVGSIPAHEHTVDGYDGYATWDNGVVLYPYLNEEQNTRVYECMARFDWNEQKYLPTDGYHQKIKDLLNTDMTVSDQIASGFPPYDNSGYHRTTPEMILSGGCINSYIGGVQGCIDGYRGSFRIRGVSPVIQNQQRAEVLLNTTGEPMVLMQRQWTGITCTCYIPGQEYPEARCGKCFTPETLVRTERGYLPISEIQVGERVLSSDGTYQSVIRTFKNAYKGKLTSIRASTGTKILSTPEHPFMVLRGEHQDKLARRCGPKCDNFILNGDGFSSRYDVRETESYRWQARVGVDYKRVVLGTFDTQEEAKSTIHDYRVANYKPGHKLMWDEAQNITTKDWLVPIWNQDVVDMESISIPQEFRKNTKLGSQRNGADIFLVDDEFLWMIGLYLAEGCAATRSIAFALHEDEIDYQNRICAFFERYGYTSSVSHVGGEETKGVRVNIYGSSLPDWFDSMFGRLCYNKRLPESFMRLPPSKTRIILDGLYCGDGSKTRREHEITQTSHRLALQVVELLHRDGKQPLLRIQQSNVLTPIGNKRQPAYTVNCEEEDFHHANRKGRWTFEDRELALVRETSEVDYDGYVYNLEVEGTNTYVVQNILVHNCYGTGFIVGWQQYFNPRRSDRKIMVRFDPTVETVEPTDSGLESKATPNGWTLTVPSIRNRDFLVRYDQAGNEEFRYEIINITRNKFVLDYTGLQKFTATRIRKTDIIYQVPVFDSVHTASTGDPGINRFRNLSMSIEMSDGFPPHTHQIPVSDSIISMTQINTISSISQGHSHTIRNGVVLDGSEVPGEHGIGHTHQIFFTLP